MAGLLDILGANSSGAYGGLLGEEDLTQAKRKAQADALLNLSASLFKAGAPSRTPQGLGLGLVEGLRGAQSAYSDSIKSAAQEKLLQQKIAQEQQSRKNTQTAGTLLPQLQRQGVSPSDPLMDIYGKEQAGPSVPQAGGINRNVLNQLMATPEGQGALKQFMDAQKMMRGESFDLAEGAQRFTTDPFTGKTTLVAQGAPKVVKPELASSFASAVDALGLPRKNASEYSEEQRNLINREMSRQRAESKSSISVNMPSEGERKAATLASRLNFSVGQMNEAIGQDPSAAAPDTLSEAARFLSQTEWLPNALNSTQRQVVEAAQSDILDAALTLGTGAAYTREQLEGYRKSYFPQIGDNEVTRRTKQARLMNLLETAQLASGRAAPLIPTPIPSAINAASSGAAEVSLSDLIAEQQRRNRNR